ncbi:MAG: polysaccharide biosynthesis C-terminal domain-containing protein [Haliscomenobacter sp.]|nr:polysaccharide biosynthesis C-terminal domain-containing protein [Haliscomenobacter sp.]
MKRAFVLNLVFLLSINLVVKPLYLFGVDRGIQNLASAAEYGLYFELFNFTFLFQILNDFGIQYYNNRHIAQHPYLLDKYFPYLLGAKFLLAGVFLFAILVFGALAGYLAAFPWMLAPIAGIHILISLISYLRSNISGLGWYFTDSFLSVLDRLILLLGLGIPLWTGLLAGRSPVLLLVFGQLVSLTITATAALWLLKRKTGGIRLRWNPRLNLVVLKNSYPYAITVILMTIYTRLDAVMIGRMLPNGQEEAGWYAGAYRLLDAANMIGVLFAGLLLPMFSKLYKDKRGLKELSDLGIRIIWSGALCLSPALIAFRTPIMDALYVHTSEQSGAILGWLMLSFIPMSGGYIFGTLLLAAGHQKKLNWLYFVGVVINVLLNLILIPPYRAAGAALATFLTQGAVFAGLLVLCQSWQGFSISRAAGWRFIILGILSWLSAFYLKKAFFSDWSWLALGLAMLVGFTGVFLFQVIRVREVADWFSSNRLFSDRQRI